MTIRWMFSVLAVTGVFYFGSEKGLAQGVGIGTTSPAPDALLELNSTTKGVLFPRLTTTQRNAIASPPHSLLIFNTDSFCIEAYNAHVGRWMCLTPSVTSVALFCQTISGPSTDQAYAMTLDGNGNIIVAGSTNSFGAGGNDVFVMKLAPSGSLMWSKAIGGSGDDNAYAVTVDGAGNIIIAGSTSSFGAGGDDVYVVKLDGAGNLVWATAVGGTGNDYAEAVTVDAAGDLVVAGHTQSFGAGAIDMYVAKLTGTGGLLWAKTYGGANSDRAYGVIADNSGNVVVAGQTFSFGAGGWDVMVMKLASSGSLIWSRTFGGGSDDFGRSVAIGGSGNIVVGGYTNSFGAGGYDAYAVKLTGSGSLVWNKTLGGTGHDFAVAVALDAGGDVIIAGWTWTFGVGNYNMYTAKFSAAGGLSWRKTVGGSNNDAAYGVAVDGSGRVVLAGRSSSFGLGGDNVYVVSMDASGAGGCSTYCTFGTGGSVITPTPVTTSPTPSVGTGGGAVSTAPTVTTPAPFVHKCP